MFSCRLKELRGAAVMVWTPRGETRGIISQPDAAQGFEEQGIIVLRFATDPMGQRSGLLAPQQADRVLAVVTADRTELVKYLG
ncbi:MAG: hypothetical protein FD187_2418 [bacterium]|nr:MAG: hypothetical protein FD187_2418 [bacterium]